MITDGSLLDSDPGAARNVIGMDSNGQSSLLTIGAFARLGGVSIKALRLYAQRGLLPPACVNSDSGYRFYSRTQLSALHRILLLKSLGLSLAEIRRQQSRRDDATLSNIRNGLLGRLEQIQRQLSWVEAEMRAGSSAASASASGVVVKCVPTIDVASKRDRIDSYDAADVMLRALGRQLPPSSRLVSGAVWHDCGQRSKVIDCEVFWMLSDSRRAKASSALAPATMASVLHVGDEATIGDAYERAHRWIADNRYRIVGPNRELYLGAFGTGLAGTLTEIQFPIETR
jgi:DNA-binding transcriptional MerR regulator